MQGWGLLTEIGIMKLHRSWKVRNFTKGLEFFHLIADVAEAQGDFYICLFTYDGSIIYFGHMFYATLAITC